jgi:hypothetical protein
LNADKTPQLLMDIKPTESQQPLPQNLEAQLEIKYHPHSIDKIDDKN